MKVLQILPAVILWGVVVVRLIGLRFGWRLGILPAVSLVAAGATLNIDAVYLAIDAPLGGRNLLNLFVHLLMGMGMTELSRLLLRATGRASRRWNAVMIAVLVLVVAQAVLLLISDTQGSATNFTDAFAHVPAVAWYQASFFAWVGLITGYTGIECTRRNRCGESRGFRIGFDIVSAACLSGVAAVTTKMALILLEVFAIDGDFEQLLYVGYRALIAITIVGFAVGFILPSYGRVRRGLRARRNRARDLGTLRPLVLRLVETAEGRRAVEAAKVSMDAKNSRTQLYRWFILVSDIRVLHPELLSSHEHELVDEIGKRIEQPGTAQPTSKVRV
ncbi:hypothetical protein [Arthrobacter sp. MAHUQ-56]